MVIAHCDGFPFYHDGVSSYQDITIITELFVLITHQQCTGINVSYSASLLKLLVIMASKLAQQI